ncbi:transglutaminase [Sphingomonas sp. DBB INV C78]|uniref:transglutaminase-like domain-containing protein n=1 Tax=Sphingomonas sp. DBB INV C78 TaxID=3349434 RepID=UPI0036D3C112
MLIRAGYEIRFEAEASTAMLAMLSIHPSRNKDLQSPHRIEVSPDIPIYDYVDAYGNICSRLTVPAGGVTLTTDFTIEDDGQPDAEPAYVPQEPVEALPDDILVYLLGSRYCETDRLMDAAWAQFAGFPSGRACVEAIVDYVHNHIRFDYEHARSDKTAWNVYQEQEGVCRDFAHLAVTLCRCMNIPARYCTGYLGDIGVPPVDAPMDFSAWFEAYLDGDWYTFDARHNRRRIGRILMACGRDAIDTALTTAFGPAELVSFQVHTEEVETVT